MAEIKGVTAEDIEAKAASAGLTTKEMADAIRSGLRHAAKLRNN